ncbi:hypothetical protein [Psychroserpens mesophilus]|uniref:hypothetical protein n=1 Tax=Psychroserpens mesophilus TaxID=325473 RepID=UPI001362FA9E|nr:hypothetical protein [Psychroserpens mesophilus]
MNHINICQSCMHRTNCVLTAQKDDVWSCSEFDEETPKNYGLMVIDENEQKKEQELELV